MRIVDVRERSIDISRYADPSLPSGGLTTSIVVVVTDVIRDGRPVVGYGFSSIGRFAQSGLIRERFVPRLVRGDLTNESGTNLDPFRAWRLMMAGEKPGGHGERCVAVGTLDMAIWDAAAKIAGEPLNRFLGEALRLDGDPAAAVPVYAGGGYYFPEDDRAHLADEVRRLLDQGFTKFKIKIGGTSLGEDLRRIECVLRLLPGPDSLAVDAMNAYGPAESHEVAKALAPYGLWWFEDICDPLDFPTLAAVAETYEGPIAAGEALFSVAEAKLLNLYGGLRKDRDVLLFDPVHCYGLPGYLQIVQHLEGQGWPRRAFWPHGGHLFCQHVVSALGLGGAEVNSHCFQPVAGLADDAVLERGLARLPERPGIGFEAKAKAWELLESL